MNIEKQTLINGRPADNHTTSDLIDLISRTEDEIRSLEKLSTKSDHITKQIADHRESCISLAKILDKRT